MAYGNTAQVGEERGMNTCIITAIHNGDTVQVYPVKRDAPYNFEEVCKRVGVMVMSSGITEVTVYRNGKVHRQCIVKSEGQS
jgi:hypothetical protein